MQLKWSKNMAFRILAVFLALILWWYVSSQNNPVKERSTRVELEQQGVPESLKIQEIPSSVTVYYRVSENRAGLVDTGDFRARVNLEGLEEGEHRIPVQLLRVPAGVNVVRVNPEVVNINLEKIEEKNIPVQLNVIGRPEPGYIHMEPVVTPLVIKAEGPGELLAGIDGLPVTVDITGASESIEKTIPVESRVESEGVKLSPGEVKINIPVEELPSNTVKINVVTEGEPASGYSVEEIVTEPSEVKVFAVDKILSEIETINTKTLDISDARSNIEKELDLLVPGGASKLSPQKVNVEVKISEEDT